MLTMQGGAETLVKVATPGAVLLQAPVTEGALQVRNGLRTTTGEIFTAVVEIGVSAHGRLEAESVAHTGEPAKTTLVIEVAPPGPPTTLSVVVQVIEGDTITKVPVS
jgi:hypothetical protein